MSTQPNRNREIDRAMIFLAALVAVVLGTIAWSPKSFTRVSTANVLQVTEAMDTIQ